MTSLGKMMIFIGAVIMAFGALFIIGGRTSWFGRLPGDIYVHKKNFTFAFPLATSIVLSIALSLGLALIMLLTRRR